MADAVEAHALRLGIRDGKGLRVCFRDQESYASDQNLKRPQTLLDLIPTTPPKSWYDSYGRLLLFTEQQKTYGKRYERIEVPGGPPNGMNFIFTTQEGQPVRWPPMAGADHHLASAAAAQAPVQPVMSMESL